MLAVHSVSKRSNLAGLRFGWYAGDADVVTFLRDVRQHAGFMVPGAGPACRHRRPGRPGARRCTAGSLLDSVWCGFGEILAAVGVEAPLPEGGIYLWAPAPQADAWGLAARLAAEAGLVVSPGEFYGPAGAGHIRVAAVAPMDRIELVASRLGAA